MKRPALRTATWLALTLLLALPAAARHKKRQSTSAPVPGSQNQKAVVAGPDYVINPGDVLDISVWKEPDISSKSLPVRPDGKISLPLVNDVQASGLTASQLADSITEKLKKFISDPQVTVVVSGINSQRYYIVGEVEHGGVFALLPGMTALQAISASGGLTQFANSKKIYILRNQNGRQVKLPFNYKQVIKGQDMQENVELKPGDTIIVP
ncbi:MAG: polysaccharide biosynthesis/export family protein [Terriglobia bacterium]